ncbi:ferritin-like protein, partial [Actinacidiphila rubida]|uniref:ferritin-like protein n=1 Tax=Actinacidiphila rubida TaxID=310780 RepID=UPI001C405804
THTTGQRARIDRRRVLDPRLPGGVRPGVTVYLSGLTRSFVHDVMMAIEEPEAPLARGLLASPTIGSFYDGLLAAFRTVAPALSPDRQVSARVGSDELKPVTSLDDVVRCLDTVKEQGEGTAASPADAFGADEPAHYYAFGEIYYGRCLQLNGTAWQFCGDPVPFPDTRPMAVVPSGGWPDAAPQVAQLLGQFDTTYHSVLDSLESAWAGGGSRSLDAAVHAMRGLEGTAVPLMETPIPGTTSTYGPLFRRPQAS